MTLRKQLLVALAIVLITACSSSHHGGSEATLASQTPTAASGAWVGRVEGTNALIALVSDGVEITGYVCDSAEIASWFRGSAQGGHVHLLDTHGVGALDAEITKDHAHGEFTDAAGKQSTFDAPLAHQNVLFRGQGTVDHQPLLGGWIVDTDGQQRGSVSLGLTKIGAPSLNGLTSPQLVTVDLGTRTAQVAASVVLPDRLVVSTPNTTAFDEFVIAGLGDSYGAGEGNPFKSANLPVDQTFTAWDKLAVAPVLAAPLGPIGLTLAAMSAPALLALAAAAHIGGEDSMPEVAGIGEATSEQWGGSTQHPQAPADEAYRHLCHRGKSPSEKAFEDLNADAKYNGVVKFVYFNFACAGSQIRHMFSTAYDGNPDKNSHLSNNQIPPQLQQLQAALGDQSSATAAARTFLASQHVQTLQDLPLLDTPVPHIDALYFSAGGNDSAFSDVITNCGVIPLPDCGNGTHGTQDEASIFHHGKDFNPDKDSTFPGLDSLPQSYAAFDGALRTLSVTRDGHAIGVTPSSVYTAEGPDPLHKTVTSLCNGSEGTLHNDLLGLLSPTDVAFAENVTNQLDQKIDDGATAANGLPRADGRDVWTAVPNRTIFFGHAICTASSFVNTGKVALTKTGDDIGMNPLFDASDGTMHPTDAGYKALAATFETRVRKQVDDMIAAPPAVPTGLREVSAVQNGAMGLRWDDNANNDNLAQLLGRTAGSTAAFTTLRSFGPDATGFTLERTVPTTEEVKLRVCSRFSHCVTSAPVVVTNEAPSIPAGLAATTTRVVTGTPIGLTATWTGVPRNLSAFVVIRAQTSSDVTHDFAVPGNGEPPVHTFALTHPVDPNATGTKFPSGTYTVRIRGCNLLGCTATSSAVTASVVNPILTPTTLIPPQGTTPNFSSPPQTIGP